MMPNSRNKEQLKSFLSNAYHAIKTYNPCQLICGQLHSLRSYLGAIAIVRSSDVNNAYFNRIDVLTVFNSYKYIILSVIV
jgi:hypothetical protein